MTKTPVKRLQIPTNIDDKTKQHIHVVQSQIGANLSAWSTVESLIVVLLREILKIDDQSAQIIFYSIGNSRTRLQVVERLAHLRLEEPNKTFALKILKDFKACSRLRNELAHAEYIYPMAATCSVQIDDNYTGGEIGTKRRFDKARMNEMRNEVRKLMRVNQGLLDLIHLLNPKREARRR